MCDNLSVQERIRKVQELALSLSCLKKGHEMRKGHLAAVELAGPSVTPFFILPHSVRPRFCKLPLLKIVRQLQLLQAVYPFAGSEC